MSVVVFVGLLPGEILIVKGCLVEPGIVVTFDIVGKMVFEEFVALEQVTDDWYFGFDYVVESFGAILK